SGVCLRARRRAPGTKPPGQPGTPSTRAPLTPAVVAATIWGAGNPDQARAVLASLPDLADQPHERLTAAASWLADLYPAPGRYWGSLQPDRLAEHLAAAVEDVPGWLVGAASAAAPGQVHNALTVLARASTHRPALTKALDSLITDQPAQVAPVAVAVALEVENPAPLAHAVDKVIARAASGAGDLDLL